MVRLGTFLGVFLAGTAFILAAVVFTFPFHLTEEMSWRAAIGSSVTTSIALMLGAIALIITARVESSDYKAQERIKSDITRLLANLASVLSKGALWHAGNLKNPDFSKETRYVAEFSASTTGFAIYSLVAQKSKAARKSSEEWRNFFLYLAEIESRQTEKGLVIDRSQRVLELLLELKESDLESISKVASNLEVSIARFSRTLDDVIAIKAMLNAGVEGRPAKNEDDLLAQLKYLKQCNIVDPGIDLFIAVIEDDTAAAKSALDRGADPHVTDAALLKKYAAEISKFKAQSKI